MIVNRKRIARIMREDNLLAVQPRSFVLTTDSAHELEVYLNVASRMKVKGVNQLWVADITYIRLKTEFVYLAVVLDAHSRKVVGWELDQTLATRLPLTAVVRAIAKRKPRPGLVHHFRSRRAVRFGRLCGSASKKSNDSEHESASQSLRQRELRELHKNAQTGGSVRHRVSRSGTSARKHRRIHRSILQSLPATLSTRLPIAGRV
jgi:transposase InsO family protein